MALSEERTTEGDAGTVGAAETAITIDVEAFDALYTENVRVVHAYAAARLGSGEGEDVTAEGFHAAVVAYRSGRAEQVTPAWLMAVTRNKVIDRWRRAERRMAKAHLLRRTEDISVPGDWSDDGRRELVLEALQRLKHRHRSLLILHHVEGVPIVDIAADTGQSAEAVQSAIGRAREAFRRRPGARLRRRWRRLRP